MANALFCACQIAGLATTCPYAAASALPTVIAATSCRLRCSAACTSVSLSLSEAMLKGYSGTMDLFATKMQSSTARMQLCSLACRLQQLWLIGCRRSVKGAKMELQSLLPCSIWAGASRTPCHSFAKASGTALRCQHTSPALDSICGVQEECSGWGKA